MLHTSAHYSNSYNINAIMIYCQSDKELIIKELTVFVFVDEICDAECCSKLKTNAVVLLQKHKQINQSINQSINQLAVQKHLH